VSHVPASLDGSPSRLPVVYFDDPCETVVECLPAVRTILTYHSRLRRHSLWLMRNSAEVYSGSADDVGTVGEDHGVHGEV
jgi:hypothetical protein